MKRHTQQPGIRQWAGEDLLELQSEPLKALDGFFEEYGPCIIKGLHITPTVNGLFDVSSGLVALSGTDVEGKNTFKVVPFAGISNVPLPLYLTLTHSVVTRPYADGGVRPIAYDYRAAVATIKPKDVSFLELNVDTASRFVDVIQNKDHRFMTDAERTKLTGIEGGANKYVHPSTHPASIITEDATHRFMTDAERTKLTGIAGGANKYVHPSTHPASIITEDATHRFMTDAERTKLTGIEGGANKYVHPGTHPASMIGFADKETLQQKYDKGKLGGELPIQTILRTDSQAGNIFGEKWLPCDGRSLGPEEYPWVEIPLVDFKELNSSLNLEDDLRNYIYEVASNGDVILIITIQSGGGVAHIHYSTDNGKTFNKLSREFQSSDATVLYLHDRFFVLFTHNIMYSLNGKDWEEGNFYGDGTFPYDVFYAYVHGYYLICDYYDGMNMYSTDGVNWYDCMGASYVTFLVIGNNVALIGNDSDGLYYNDGATEWKIPKGLEVGSYYDYFIAYVKGRFWLINRDDTDNDTYNGCWESLDGINWTKLSNPAGLENPYLSGWNFVNNCSIILAMSPSASHKKYKSIDGGLTFTEYSSEKFPNRVINDVFVFVNKDAWAQSVDGENWEIKQLYPKILENIHIKRSIFSVNGNIFSVVDDNKLVCGKLGYNVPIIEDHYIKVK